jgi:3-dehydroquinate dehydratase-2
MADKILIIHGAGLDMRGRAQVEVFGPMTLVEYDEHIHSYARQLEVEVDIFHSNIEGEVINRLYAAHDQGFAGAVLNPGAYMSGHPALCAAIGQVSFPVWELHISNPARRGRASEVAAVVQGVVTGFGIHGYYLAMQGVKTVAASG